MKVRVKLYGTLSQRFPGYQPSQGIEVEIPDGATARDLLALLDIPDSHGVTIVAEGRVLKADDRIRCGVPVSVLQVIYGG